MAPSKGPGSLERVLASGPAHPGPAPGAVPPARRGWRAEQRRVVRARGKRSKARVRPVAALPCPYARHFVDTTLAVVVSEHDNEQRIAAMADTVAREITRWG